MLLFLCWLIVIYYYMKSWLLTRNWRADRKLLKIAQTREKQLEYELSCARGAAKLYVRMLEHARDRYPARNPISGRFQKREKTP